MKKIIAIILVVVLTLSLFGCKGNDTPVGTTDPTVNTEATLGDHEHDHGEATKPTGGETTEPTDESTEPSTEATTEPTEESTEPSTEATEPSTEPTVPADPGDIGNGGVEDNPGQTEPQPTEHKHSYTSKVTEPTCESKGYTTYTCACGDSYKGSETKATGHNYTSKTVAPTASAEGYDVHTCTKCGDSYKDNYKPKTEPQPTEHQHNYKAVTVAPGCVKIGYTEYTCSCGHAYRDDTTNPIGHKYSTKTVAPTASAEGYDLHTCERCGDSYKDNYVPKTGNSGGNDSGDHTGCYWGDADNDGEKEWVPHDCNTKGHLYKSEVIQEGTCCQPEIKDRRCYVVGCNAQASGYPKESWTVPHTGDASLCSYATIESYTARRSDGQAWNFDNEASVRAKAKEVADAYRNGESRHYVEWISYMGWTVVYPETFTCKTCGQTINYREMKAQNRATYTGTLPENPYANRRWEEKYTKDNQP